MDKIEKLKKAMYERLAPAKQRFEDATQKYEEAKAKETEPWSSPERFEYYESLIFAESDYRNIKAQYESILSIIE